MTKAVDHAFWLASFGICHLLLAPSLGALRRAARCVRSLFALADESITGLLSGLDDGNRGAKGSLLNMARKTAKRRRRERQPCSYCDRYI